jgi:hypothetical protein
MEQRTSDAPIGAVLTGIGGGILAVGSVLSWAKASIDLGALAKALGVDPSLLSGTGAVTSKSFTGTSIIDGKITLACGVVAIVVAVAAYMRRELWKTLGILAIVAGLVGGGLALYDITTKEDVVTDAKDAAAPSLAAAGIDVSVLDDVFDVTLGIGIWLSVAGGAVVLIGGLLLIAKRSALPPSMAGTGLGPSAYTPPPPPPPESATGTGTPEGGEITPPQV